MWAAALALLAALLAPLLPPSLAVPPAQATCSTAGPATRQLNTARLGGTVLSDAALPAAAAGNISAAAAICAERCCAAVYEHASETQPCRSWTVHHGNCSLRGLYSAPTELTGAVSGVVYRTGVQDERVGTIRGFNYVPAQNPSDLHMWRDYSEAVIERDMGFAQTAGFNFARVFLSYTVWSESNSSLFLGRLQHFVATAHSNGVQTMPVIFDPCYDGCKGENITIKSDGDCWYPSPKPSDMESEAWWSSGGQAFVRALVAALPPGTPGLAMWDAVNEPGHRASGLPFATKVADYLREISPQSNVTIGLGEELADPQQTVVRLEQVAPHVDILSFHSYHDSWELGLEITELALSVARKHNKPVFNSETGCIARASAFDQTMEMAARNGIGFAVWELMISDCLDCADTRRWKHGLLYTDGTTRDPAAIAAVRGIYLNRGDEVALAVPKTDVEHKPDALAKAVAGWLAQTDSSSASASSAHAMSCSQPTSQIQKDTNLHGGAMGAHPYRAVDVSTSADPLTTCSKECCAWSGCAAWVLQSGTEASKNDQQCTATTTTCCWLKPNADGPRTALTNSTTGVVAASPKRPAGPPGPPPPPGPGHFSLGVGLLDGIANVVESAGLSASAVPLSGAARRLAAAGLTAETMAELRELLQVQTMPGAALLAAAPGMESVPAVCTFNASAR